MAKKGLKYSSQRSVHGLSLPNIGGIWKDKMTGIEFVVMGKTFNGILVRERSDLEGEPIKVDDIMGFYAEYSYVGKIQKEN